MVGLFYVRLSWEVRAEARRCTSTRMARSSTRRLGEGDPASLLMIGTTGLDRCAACVEGRAVMTSGGGAWKTFRRSPVRPKGRDHPVGASLTRAMVDKLKSWTAHVRFEQRRRETGRIRGTAPFLDATVASLDQPSHELPRSTANNQPVRTIGRHQAPGASSVCGPRTSLPGSVPVA